MALVILPVALSWPVFLLALVFTAAGLVAVLHDGGRRIVGLCVALGCAGVLVAIPRAICDVYPWLIECWCRWCL